MYIYLCCIITSYSSDIYIYIIRRSSWLLPSWPRIQMEDLSLVLGPGSSSWGRRPRRQLATVAIGDKDSDSDGSEPDLGR